MINTVPFTSLAGTAFLTIGVQTNANVEMDKMGDVKYEFDLVPTDATVRGVSGIPGSLTVTMWDRMDTGTSLYEAIETEIGDYDGLEAVTVPTAPVTLYWLPRGESNIDNAWRFPFDLRFMDATIDERSQKTTLRFAPKTLNLNIESWATGNVTNNFPTTVYDFRDDVGTKTAYLAGDLIYDALGELDTGVGNVTIMAPRVSFPTSLIAGYVNTYPTTTNLTATNMNTYPPTIVVGVDQAFASNQLVYDKVRVLAGLDAAIFGSAFGINYYMPRNNNSFNVELTNVEFEDLSFVASPRSINAVALAYTNSNVINTTLNIGNGYPFLYATNGVLDAWKAADQQINIAYSSYFPHLNYGKWINTNLTFINGIEFIDPTSLLDFPELVQTIQVFDTAIGYALSTGAWTSNASTYKIEATILGADKVRPYEVIKFDNTVPLRYQGKHFRPTSLSYDLKADKVKVTAYQIDTFPIPTANIEVNVGNCDPMFVVSYTAFNTFTNVFSDEDSNTFLQNVTTFNTFTNVFADETGENTTSFMAENSGITAFSNADGDTSNVTSISL
jgi:hypothetical protein